MTRFPFLDWRETQTLVAAFERAGQKLRFVGGAVRDALLGLAVQDVDAATPALPGRSMEVLQGAGIKALPTGLRHGTVTALIDGRAFEITTLRKDVATDGRHAEVAFVEDWKEDAARRDFTMNALYVSPQGELFDYFGGAEDASGGVVKFIGDASQRIAEDYLRILRYFRFHAWYGKTSPDAATLAHCQKDAAQIDRLSGERIAKEMLKLLAAPQPVKALGYFDRAGLSPYVFGGDIDLAALARAVQMDMGLEPLARLALLLGDRPAQKLWLAQRWKLSREQADFLQALQAHIPPDALDMQLRELWRRHGERVFRQSVALSAANAQSADAYCHMLLLEPPPKFPLAGRDLQAAGMEEGQALGAALQQLEQAWVESGYRLTKEQLLARCR